MDNVQLGSLAPVPRMPRRLSVANRDVTTVMKHVEIFATSKQRKENNNE
jgi:hypothetical protein